MDGAREADELVLRLEDPLLTLASLVLVAATVGLLYEVAGILTMLGDPFTATFTPSTTGPLVAFGMILAAWTALLTGFLVLLGHRRAAREA